MDNQDQLNKLFSLFNGDKLLTKQDIDDIVAALVKVLATHKQDYEGKTGEMRDMVEATVKDVLEKYDLSVQELKELSETSRRQTNQEVKARIEMALDSVQRLADEIETHRPKDGADGRDGKDGKDAISPSIEEIITEVLKRLPNQSSTSTQLPTVVRGGGIRQQIHILDLSDQCDGSNKTFKVPLNFGILGLYSTQAPIIYRPGIDYTVGHRTLTLTDQVGAPQTGQTLTLQYLK